MNQKPYNKCLINLVCSVCTGKYLPSVFSHRPTILAKIHSNLCLQTMVIVQIHKISKIKGGFPVKWCKMVGNIGFFNSNEYCIVMTMFFELFLLRKISEVPSGTRTHNLLIAGETL